MRLERVLIVGIAAAAVAACSSGDINIDPQTNVVDSNNTGDTVINGGSGGAGTPEGCAGYQTSGGQVINGQFNGVDCIYPSSFLGAGNPLTVDMTLKALANDGAHIFQGTVFVGKAYGPNDDAARQADGIFKGGDGPTLTIEAGTTVAFETKEDFLVINRGSQIFAVGTKDAPITLTSVSDIEGTVGPEDVQQWGGLVLEGFGITNKCAYTGTRGVDLALDGLCNVLAEGSVGLTSSWYGGDREDDSSGRLEYLVVKHTGAEVAPGSELNGVSFGAVGSGTVVSHLEIYSAYDDAIEMFGGAVDIDHYVAVYARDDSIDIDEGYSGTIGPALVIQSETDGNQCIESDGLGSYDSLTTGPGGQVESKIAQGLNSRPTIHNLTCIVSPDPTGTHDPGKGWRFREGIFPTVKDALVVSSFQADQTPGGTDNACLQIENRSRQAALDGDLKLESVIMSCDERTTGADLGDGTTEEEFFTGAGNLFANVPSGGTLNPTAAVDPSLQLLEGSPPIYSIAFATSSVDDVSPPISTIAPPAPTPTEGTYLGALSLSEEDWTAGWTFGIHPDNRSEDLWFE